MLVNIAELKLRTVAGISASCQNMFYIMKSYTQLDGRTLPRSTTTMTPSTKSRDADDATPEQANKHPQSPGWLQRLPLHTTYDVNIYKHPYTGSGTTNDPCIVAFLPQDPRDPRSFSKARKWTIALV